MRGGRSGAIVAEGFEAGGHNGREETTTMCLIPAVRKATSLPLLAAGGIGNGQAMLAALALGADGVQIGTRFALTKESSAHENFKKLCLNLKEGDTKLLLKKLSPTRLVKGDFATAVEKRKPGERPWKNYVSYWAKDVPRKESLRAT